MRHYYWRRAIVEAHYNLAKALDAYGDMDGAIKHLETAVVLEAHHLKSYNYLGILYRKQGRTNEAVGIYRRALELNGDFMAVRYITLFASIWTVPYGKRPL